MNISRYKCHKEVCAFKIAKLEGCLIYSSDGDCIEVDAKMFSRYTPLVGDYYVIYEDDYKSFSPAKAFEDGYSLMV